ncbi:MAG: haloacid dehalogenase-like hydrolase [Pseudomonadota bacterium]|nr:haloacid dehalogenase-like hydrolase [Pseudomonadota bacterium]
MRPAPLVLFDVDGTLFHGPSAELVFAQQLAKSGKIGLRQALAWVGFNLRYGPVFGADVLKKNKAYLWHCTEASLAEDAARLVDRLLAQHANPLAVAQLNTHVQRGDQVVLLTGTHSLIAEALCQRLSCAGYYASVSPHNARGYRLSPPTSHPYAARKLVLARRLWTLGGFLPENTWAYADSIHDLFLLEQVGHPVAVNPDVRLKRIARRRGWPILSNENRPATHPANPSV